MALRGGKGGVSNVTNLTNLDIHLFAGPTTMYLTRHGSELSLAARKGVLVMKLPLIAVSVVLYTVLALSWIVYAGLTPPNPLF